MDYSSIHSDTEHPEDSDPWASSPKATKQPTFQHPSPEVLARQSLPPPAGYGSAAGGGSGHARNSSDDQNLSQSTDETEETDVAPQDLSERLQSAGPGEEGYENTPRLQFASPTNPQAHNSRLAPPQRMGQRGPPIPQYKLQAKITGLERPGRKEAILKFDVTTNLPRFRTTHFKDVRRTHAEFVKYAEYLISANPEAIVPAVPPATTSAGVGTDEDEARVKAAMQRWMNYVCGNPYLMRDEETILFVESDFGYSPMNRMKQPATGVRRKYLKQFAPPPDETPELSDARPIVKQFYLGTMDAGHKLDKVVKWRRGLSLAESELGSKLSSMHAQESHPGLAKAYFKLGHVIQSVADFHAQQSTAESTTLRDLLQYHSADAFIVKETLTNRQILLREYLQAQAATHSKRVAADRVRSSSTVKRERADDALAALDDAQATEDALRERTQRVTANLVQDRRRWFARTAADLKLALRDYTVRQIEAERRTLATLESVRPEIRSIDASGGLSRLGREALGLPPVAAGAGSGSGTVEGRRSSRVGGLGASQGPKGDSWSGVPRPAGGLNRSLSASVQSVGGQDGDDGVGGGGEAGGLASPGGSVRGGEGGLEFDGDRVDARNAASRLAQSTF